MIVERKGSQTRAPKTKTPPAELTTGGFRKNGTLLLSNLTESCRLNDWMVQPKARRAGSGSRGTMPTSRLSSLERR